MDLFWVKMKMTMLNLNVERKPQKPYNMKHENQLVGPYWHKAPMIPLKTLIINSYEEHCLIVINMIYLN
jgi:hypothetical protein